jgi:DNA-binding HxlR family transcriptional regulator
MTADAPYAFDGLDRVIHEKARLSILTSLISHADGLSFNELKSLCALTDGNLSRHVAVLQEAGLVAVTKGFEGNRPHTTCALTPAGRQKFMDYLNELERVLKNAAGAPSASPSTVPGSLKPA